MAGEQPEPTPARPISRGLRFTGGATLAGLALIVVFIALTIAFPTLGAPSSFSGIIYIPPQAYAVVALAPLTTILGFIAGFEGAGQSWRARRYDWVAVFVALLALLVIGPAFLIYEFGVDWGVFAHILGLPTPRRLDGSVGTLLWVSFTALLLMGVCALFAGRSAHPAR